jgi:hypothetical protein
MNTSVTRLSRKLHATKFGSVYPRQARETTLYPAGKVDPEAANFVHVEEGYKVGVAKPPRPNWHRSLELNAQQSLNCFNQPLLYRALYLLYGEPDVVTALVSEVQSTAHALDWSYTLTINPSIFCEVRSKNYSRVHLVFWGPDGHPNSPACGHLKLPHLN